MDSLNVNHMPDLLVREPRTCLKQFRHREFVDMSREFSRHGGMMTPDELVSSMRSGKLRAVSTIARWVDERLAIHLVWRGKAYFPSFQFGGNPTSIRQPVAQALHALRDAFDDWELALWFASANSWLGNRSPLEAIDLDGASVVHAAQADRLIALG
jgi:hypothetical protein